MLDGEGGDELFAPGRLSPVRALLHPHLPSRWELAKAAVAIAPRPARKLVYRRYYRRRLEMPWLRGHAWRQLEVAIAADHAAEPADRRKAIRRHRAVWGIDLMLSNMARLAAEYDVLDLHPLLEPPVTSAVGRAGGVVGFPDRTTAMRVLFGELLSDDLLRRHTKARFNRVAFNDHSRAFVEAWDGKGVDPDLVDADALLRTWRAREPHGLSFALLQACWLHSQARPAA